VKGVDQVKQVFDAFRSRSKGPSKFDLAHEQATGFVALLERLGLRAKLHLDSNDQGAAKWSITLAQCPISIWLRWTSGDRGALEPTDLRIDSYESTYLVYDPRILRLRSRFAVRTVYRRTTPVFGRTVAFRWGGHDAGLGLLNALAGDQSLQSFFGGNESLSRGGIPFKIVMDRKALSWRWRGPDWTAPSAEMWQAYLAISGHLLSINSDNP
jgi:hypothetical protein